MIRTQIQLEERQYERLKALAVRQSKSVAQLVREGVEQVLANAEREDRWARLMAVAGTCHDAAGASDVAARHDDYLTGAYGGEG